MGRCRGVTLEWQRGNKRQGRKHEWLSTVLRCFTHQVTPKRTFFPASQSFINSSPPINTNERQNFTTVTRFVQSAAANTTRRKGINRCSTRRFVKVVVAVRLMQVSGSVDSICWSYFIFTQLVLIVLFFSKYWILFLTAWSQTQYFGKLLSLYSKAISSPSFEKDVAVGPETKLKTI